MRLFKDDVSASPQKALFLHRENYTVRFHILSANDSGLVG